MRVLIVCPIGVKTGGPQALHQLCHELNILGVDSYLIPSAPGEVQAEVSFSHYMAPIFEGNGFEPDDFLVVPETLLVLSPEFKGIDNSRTFIWWLSVDNSPLPWANNYEVKMNKVNSEWGLLAKSATSWFTYLYERLFEFKYGLLSTKSNSKFHRINPRKVNNLCQSAYAMNVLQSRGVNSVGYLSDYVEVKQGVASTLNNPVATRIRVVYNFAKSREQVEVLKSLDGSVDFIPLSGLSATDMAEEFKNANLFLDLGHFPGKDRLPREAILLGCPVLIAKRGAARYEKDFPLDDSFLIDLEFETPANVLSKIYRIASDKGSAFAQQGRFFDDVIRQKEIFSEEVKNFKNSLNVIKGGIC